MFKSKKPSETKTSSSDEGMPIIADDASKNKKFLILIVVVALAMILGGYFIRIFSNKKIQEASSVQEVYTSEGDAHIKLGSSKTTAETIGGLTPDERESLMRDKQKELQQRLGAPLLVVNNQNARSSIQANNNGANTVTDPNTQFMNQASAQAPETSVATTITPLNYLIAQGSLIHAVLETAINSDLPGYLRAIVSQPVYSEDGSNILVPQGSRLIGEYKSGMLDGQERVFVVWTRIVIPGGISINIGSPGVDNLGVAGMGADSIDRHFWERFGTAILLSVISAGAENVSVSKNDQYNSEQAYRIAVANSFAQTAAQSFRQNASIAPTLRVNQGKPIMVFVAKDLQFKNAMQLAKPKLNVF